MKKYNIKTMEKFKLNAVGEDASVRLRKNQNRNNIITFDKHKSNVVGSGDSLIKKKHINQPKSKKLISHFQNLTSNTAITLVALVITIIVLLILVGITLSLTLGENGIFNKAQLASKRTKIAEIRDDYNLNVINEQTQRLSEGKDNLTLDEVANLDNVEKFTKNNNGGANFIYKGYKFVIDSNLKIISIDGEKQNEDNSQDSGNTSGGGTSNSNIINGFNIKVDGVTGKNVRISIDGDITTNNNSKIAGYLVFANNKCIDVISKLPASVGNLERNTQYNIKVKAVDEKGNLKESNNMVDVQTLNYNETILEYPIITKTGVANIKFTNPDNEDDFYYALDLSKDCTAIDALDKAAYDGDETTYFDPNSGKCKFYFGSDIDIYNVCFKIDSSYNGILFLGSRRKYFCTERG